MVLCDDQRVGLWPRLIAGDPFLENRISGLGCLWGNWVSFKEGTKAVVGQLARFPGCYIAMTGVARLGSRIDVDWVLWCNMARGAVVDVLSELPCSGMEDLEFLHPMFVHGGLRQRGQASILHSLLNGALVKRSSGGESMRRMACLTTHFFRCLEVKRQLGTPVRFVATGFVFVEQEKCGRRRFRVEVRMTARGPACFCLGRSKWLDMTIIAGKLSVGARHVGGVFRFVPVLAHLFRAMHRIECPADKGESDEVIDNQNASANISFHVLPTSVEEDGEYVGNGKDHECHGHGIVDGPPVS